MCGAFRNSDEALRSFVTKFRCGRFYFGRSHPFGGTYLALNITKAWLIEAMKLIPSPVTLLEIAFNVPASSAETWTSREILRPEYVIMTGGAVLRGLPCRSSRTEKSRRTAARGTIRSTGGPIE